MMSPSLSSSRYPRQPPGPVHLQTAASAAAPSARVHMRPAGTSHLGGPAEEHPASPEPAGPRPPPADRQGTAPQQLGPQQQHSPGDQVQPFPLPCRQSRGRTESQDLLYVTHQRPLLAHFFRGCCVAVTGRARSRGSSEDREWKCYEKQVFQHHLDVY